MKKIYQKILLIILLLFSSSIIHFNGYLLAQEVRKPVKILSQESPGFQLKYGMGLSTRYVWRGLDLAKSPALEPYAIALFSNFEISLNGIFGLFENAAKHPDFVNPRNPQNISIDLLNKIAFNEIITNLFYHIKAEFGTIRIGFTDYYFTDGLVKKVEIDPIGVTNTTYPKSTWLNWEDNGEGAHTIETSLRFDGNKNFPLWIFVGINIYNDPNNSVYVETGYTFNLSRNKFTMAVGSAIGASSWYQFNLIDGALQGDFMTSLSLSFSREIYVDDWLVIDFSLRDVINFYEERNIILFNATLKIE